MENIILYGMKNTGKTTLAEKIATHYDMGVIHIDDLFTKYYEPVFNETLTFREIHKKHGADYFRTFETNIVRILSDLGVKKTVIDCGGGTPLKKENTDLLKKMGVLVWVKLDTEINYERIIKNGIPAFFKYQDDPKRSFEELVQERFPIYEELADITIEFSDETPDQVLNTFINAYEQA